MSQIDPEKRRAYHRAWYAKNAAKVIAKVGAHARANRTWMRPHEREKRIAYKRLQRRLAGAKDRPSAAELAEHAQDRLCTANAMQAWRYWLALAPSWWLDRYWAAHARPWRDPRLSIRDRSKIRYSSDPKFHAREYQRLQLKKRRDRIYLLEAMARPGALTDRQTNELRDAPAPCVYCGCIPTGRNRTIDHVIPLSRGGAHDRFNVVKACRSCNSSKQDNVWTPHA